MSLSTSSTSRVVLVSVGALSSWVLCAQVAAAQPADNPSVVVPAAPPAQAAAEPSPATGATEPTAQPDRPPAPHSEPRDLTFGRQEAYRKLLEDADSDLQYGAFDEARTNYALAHDLQPGAPTERGLGRVALALKDYATAASHFEAVLTATWDALPEAQQAEVQGWLEECRKHTGSFVLTTDPPDARVAVDGTYTTLEAGALVLPIGSHVLRASAAGRASSELKVDVVGGERGVPLQLALPVTSSVTAVPVEASARRELFQAAETDEASAGSGLLSQWWLWTAVGVAVAGGVTTALLLYDPGTTTRASRVDADVAGRIVALELP